MRSRAWLSVALLSVALLSVTLLCGMGLLAAGGWAQPPGGTPDGTTIEIRGDRKLAEAEQLHAIWLYP